MKKNISDVDHDFIIRDEDPEDINLSRTEGSYLIDKSGKKYIDFKVGWCVGNLGWSLDEIREKVFKPGHPTYVLPDYQYDRWTTLGKLLADVTPGNLSRSVRATSGTEAVEAAMQMAKIYTGRNKFLSVEGSYHGNSIGALSIGSSHYKEAYKSLLPGCYKIDPPLDRKAANKVETKLKRREIAALIMEPVILNLGVLIPEKEFMERIDALCRHYKTLLVMDEVATGFGRTGRMFGSEYYNITPDIICMAKGITGGYAGLGATITTPLIAKSLRQKGFSFYSTFGWHPIAVEAAIANISYMVKHKNKLMQHVKSMNQYFTTRLEMMTFKNGVSVHSRGMAIAANVGNRNYAGRIRNKCQEAGLLLATRDESLIFFPAINIDQETARKGLDILEQNI